MATPGLDHWADITVVVLYFICVLIVGMWTVFRRSRNNVNNYFLAGRNISWWPVGASLFSSNIGSEHFVGLAGTGAAAGIAMISYEWFSMPLVLLLGWFFLPVYISAGVYTLPEYMEKRFGGYRIRIYLSVLALILYIVTKLAVSIFAGALFIQLALGWDMYVSIMALLGVTAIYTILGGLAAVIYTDTFQTGVMTIGALALVGISFNEIGGYNNLQRKYMEAVPSVRNLNSSCGLPRDDAFHIFRDPVTGDNPWPGLLLQSSLGCLWYWCCDQVIVQRTLAARNLSHAKGGSILAGYLKLLPIFLMIFPGMISRALYPDEVACVDPQVCMDVCDNPVGCSNIAYPKLVLELLPFGVRGLLMAVMLSAIMSSLTSIFNSSSTIFTMDLWRRARPRATERELLIVGRIFIVILCGISIAWIPLVRSSQGGQLFNYIQAIQGYLGTPIGALFVLGVFWKRMNEQGAFWGILIGHICGVVRMGLDFAYPAPDCGDPETRPPILLRVHYTYFGTIMIVVTSAAIVIISLCTRQQDEEQLEGVTWWTRLKPEDKGDDSTDSHIDQEKDTSPATNGVQISEPEDADESTVGCAKRACNYVCGMPDSDSGAAAPSADLTQIRGFLKENKRWTRVLNINAAIGLIVTAFLYGFYR
ncbi:sodium/glucose cotransporter 4-like [Pecten maximus]|uniref:sodium/glucose cotransporter 4-like n=1 Tax=Pecten maximus TaxID=6579 RepID=UPI0014585E8B|nr:sodium/glucose cotransporter 4-like [Pecten maximus]